MQKVNCVLVKKIRNAYVRDVVASPSDYLHIFDKMIWVIADNFDSFCGKSITLTKEDTAGVIMLDY